VQGVAVTGTGSYVKATSPTLVTPVLGTPASGNLSNCTALPLGSITGLGSGVATFLATPSSANFAAAVTGETGTGGVVFDTAPTISALTTTGVFGKNGVDRISATVMGADAIDVTKANNTKSFTVDKTFTYSAVGTAGDMFSCTFSNTDSADHTVTMPANTVDYNTGLTGTNIWTISAGTKVKLFFESDGTNWTMFGSTSVAPRKMVSVSAAKGFTLVDAGVAQRHPAADTTARTWTIPANASIAFPIGTVIPLYNEQGAGALTIAITTDTLELAGSASTTGSRTIATGGVGILTKTAATIWMLGGPGVT